MTPPRPPSASHDGASPAEPSNRSRRAFFDPDAPGLSGRLHFAFILNNGCAPGDGMRAKFPRTEAMVFLHAVTGLGDIDVAMEPSTGQWFALARGRGIAVSLAITERGA